MKKLLLLLFLSVILLTSCNQQNKVIEYLNELDVHDLINYKVKSIDMLYLSNNQLDNLNVSKYNDIKDTDMVKYNKMNDNKFDFEYKYALKDIRFNYCYIINENDKFYVGESGYLYRFYDEFYYRSTLNIFNENIKTVKTISEIISESSEMLYGDLSDDSITELRNYLSKIELIEMYETYNYDYNDILNYVNEETKDGITIAFDDTLIKISRDSKLYLISDSIYTIPSIDENNYYDIINELRFDENDNIDVSNFVINDFVGEFDKIIVNPILDYDGRLYLDSDIYDLFKNEVLNRYEKDDYYYSVLNACYKGIKLSFNLGKSLYIGEDGYIYYFTDKYYYKSSNGSYYDDVFTSLDARYQKKNMRLLKDYLYSSNYEVKNIEIILNGKVLKKITDFNSLLDQLSKVELYYVGNDPNLDNVQQGSNEVIFYSNLKKDLYMFKVNFTNNKYIELHVNDDGSIIYGVYPIFINSFVDGFNYYKYIQDLLKTA